MKHTYYLPKPYFLIKSHFAEFRSNSVPLGSIPPQPLDLSRDSIFKLGYAISRRRHCRRRASDVDRPPPPPLVIAVEFESTVAAAKNVNVIYDVQFLWARQFSLS